MGDENNRRGSIRTGPAIPTRMGAKRDQYGNLLPTPQAPQNNGQLSAAHDFGAFDAVFHPVKEEAKPVVAKVAPPVAAAHIRTNGATNASVPTMTTPTTVANPPNVTAPAVTRPTSSGGIANPPPMNNARPGQSATASLAPQVRTRMKAIPAPVTSPTGDKNTDAFNLAQNKSMYAPGGMTERVGQPAPIQPGAIAAAHGRGGYVAAQESEAPSVADAYAIQNRYQTKGTVAKLTPGSVRDVAGAGGFPRVGPLAGQPPAATGVAGPTGATGTAPIVAKPAVPTPVVPAAPDTSIKDYFNGATPPAAPAQAAPAPVVAGQPSEPITPNSVGQAIYNTPGAVADVAQGAYETARDAVVPVVQSAANTVENAGNDFTAGLQGKTPEQWRAENAAVEQERAMKPAPAPVPASPLNIPSGMVHGPMTVGTVTGAPVTKPSPLPASPDGIQRFDSFKLRTQPTAPAVPQRAAPIDMKPMASANGFEPPDLSTTQLAPISTAQADTSNYDTKYAGMTGEINRLQTAGDQERDQMQSSGERALATMKASPIKSLVMGTANADLDKMGDAARSSATLSNTQTDLINQRSQASQDYNKGFRDRADAAIHNASIPANSTSSAGSTNAFDLDEEFRKKSAA